MSCAPKELKNVVFHMFHFDTDKEEYVKTERGAARFHQWGLSYEYVEGVPAQYTTAIIELPDGSIENVPAENIRFVENEQLN